MRIPALDGLRAVAILSVMSFHANLWFAGGGSLGVDIFFVLSGWLITGLLADETERTGTVDRPAFLARRLRRLLPALSCLLLAYLLVAPWLYPQSADRRWFDAATAFLYLTNLRETVWPADTPLSHTWSLAVEAQFYLAWPFVVPALLRLGRHRAARLLCVAWVCLTALRFAWPAMVGGAGTYYFTPLHATGLLLGSALALQPISARRGPVALALLVAIMVGVRTFDWWLYVLPLAEVATVLVVADPPRLLAWPPLQVVGRVSYGMYLWHVPLLWIMPTRTPPQAAAFFVATLVAGWMSAALVERWFTRGGGLTVHPGRPGRTPAKPSSLVGRVG
ncbi:acyltransferase [Sphingomonas ginsenosidivorax]|uniref:Acyltransferase n=1 Tax=Sphingomonas ginsenosidivorax TaxID=862135 RepID=A0A5C6UIM3_9SPHN|nr:acyltransferase [Sphingomonas ginsenosidivorax]TXC71818.1 acyltransferase [Sphingomonas ginsenosidivorax]